MTDKRHLEGASSPADDHSVDHPLAVDLEKPVDGSDVDHAADDPMEDVDSEVLDLDDLMDAAFPEAKARFSVQLDELMPTTRRALNVLNRVFNYSDRRKNVIVSGNYGTGRGYLIEAWLSNLSALPRLDEEPLHVIRFDTQGLQDRLEQLTGFSDIDLSDILIALFSNLEAVCADSGQQTIMLMDDADMAAKILHLAPSLRIVVRLSNYDANRFVLQCRERIKDFDVISMDEYMPTWRELTAEVDRVNEERFIPRYDDSLEGDALLDFMRAVWKLDSGSTKSPRMNDVVDMPIGRFIELVEQAHAKLMEPGYSPLSRSSVRRLAADLYDEEPNVLTYEPVVTGDGDGGFVTQSAVDSPASDTIVWSGAEVDAGGAETGVEDESIPGSIIRKKKKGKPLPYSDVMTLAARLKAKIVNQDAAVDAIVDNVKIDAAGLRNANRPIGVFLFEGPSGVGKTELARQLALELYSKPVRLQKLDMGEYTTEDSVIKLFGAPTGYKDSDAGGQLTNAVLADPQSVILFDEAEKASPRVWDSLLQVFNDGEMTDGLGHKVDFTNTIIILTSNLGNGAAQKGRSGFKIASSKITDPASVRQQPGGSEEYSKITKTATEKYFKTELLNRLDAIVVFNSLRREDLRRILKIQMSEIADRLKSGKSSMVLDTDLDGDLVEWLLERSESVKFGAREMQRTLRKTILLPLANWMIQQDLVDGGASARVGEHILRFAYDGRSNKVVFSLIEGEARQNA